MKESVCATSRARGVVVDEIGAGLTVLRLQSAELDISHMMWSRNNSEHRCIARTGTHGLSDTQGCTAVRPFRQPSSCGNQPRMGCGHGGCGVHVLQAPGNTASQRSRIFSTTCRPCSPGAASSSSASDACLPQRCTDQQQHQRQRQ
jgi:hypothetical protein